MVAPSPAKKPNAVKSKFKELIHEKKKKQCDYEKVHALYKTMPKVKQTDEPAAREKKPAVPRFSKDNFFISRPTVPMVEQFYEKYIKDQSIIDKGITEGKFVQGTLYFDKSLSNKWDAYVKVAGLPQSVKVRGLKYLNRALHLDTVVLKFVNWVQWEKAQPSLTKNIDFEEMAEDDPYQTQ